MSEDTNPDNLLEDDAPTASVGMLDDATAVKYHPIRGAFYGLLAGFGLAIYLISFKVINLSLVVPIIVMLVCAALGAAWGRFGPAKQASS